VQHRRIDDGRGAGVTEVPRVANGGSAFVLFYLVGLIAIVVPLMFALERGLAPALWIQAAIWLPVTLVLCLALLPVMKGGTVGLCWASGLVRQAPPGSEPPRD